MIELDDRWEWVEVTALGDAEPRYVKGRCKHLELEPVHIAVGGVDTGERVATLCRTCDVAWDMEGQPLRR